MRPYYIINAENHIKTDLVSTSFFMAIENFWNFYCMEILKIIHKQDLGLVIDPVIKATTRLELDDRLRMEVLNEGCW